ncbi:MAG TPA: NAD(P)-dependent oxidoreductase [Ktedonobacteraceae bacterium]|jgi:3-hydroxyisobutyrate dehydrogenase-like beta-hydroxyacid dehydrogenase|nr:NAD(P)-dependent oxidoreductase [Ktedonobacteraceae bacterium]
MTTYNSQGKPGIGFIGLGYMGVLMVQRLVQAGYSVTVYDRTKEKALEVARKNGIQTAERPCDLAAQCDVVMSIVTDNFAVEAIMYGPDGVLAGVRPQTTIIDLSTVSPEVSRRVFASAQEKGAHMIDSAVSGSTPQASEGNLVIFVGGEQEVYQRCKPILDQLGKSIFYMGASGAGTTMKMVVNTLLGLGLQAVAEAVSLGEKAGLDKQQLVEVLGQTTAIAPAHKAKLTNLKNETYPVNFALPLMRKDFSLILQMAAKLSVAMPATAAAAQMYAAAMAQGHDEDFSVMLRFMEELNGLPTGKKEQ